MEHRSLDINIQSSSITIQLKNESLVTSIIEGRKIGDLERELSRLMFDWISKSNSTAVERSKGGDCENYNTPKQNDDRWQKIEAHARWAKEKSDHTVSVCRAANDVVLRNADILNKAILSQTLRNNENRHSNEISLLAESLERTSKDLALSRDENHIIAVQLTVTKRNFGDLSAKLTEVQRLLQKVTSEHSSCQTTAHDLRRQLSEKQAHEIELNRIIQDFRRQNYNQQEQMQTFYESEEKSKTTIFSLKLSIKSLEEEIQQRTDREQKERSDNGCCPQCKSNISPKRKGAKRRMKNLNRLETNLTQDNNDGGELIRTVQRKNKTLELTVCNVHEQIDKVRGELETSNKQRDFYRTLLRGKNISQLVNKVAEVDELGQCCQLCKGRIDMGRPFTDDLANSFERGSSSMMLPELDHRHQHSRSFDLQAHRRKSSLEQEAKVPLPRKGSIEHIMQKRHLKLNSHIT